MVTITYRKYEPPSTVLAMPDQQPTDREPGRPLDTAERDLDAIRKLISQDLSEPYGIYVYRYFIYQWPHLCFLAVDGDVKPSEGTNDVVGVVVCKLAPHRSVKLRGYIAMLAVAKNYRGRGIATELVKLAIERMIKDGADEIVLETEVDNESAMRLYENLGFIRSKRMHRYYMNASDAFRLVLPVKQESTMRYCVLANELDAGQVDGTEGLYI